MPFTNSIKPEPENVGQLQSLAEALNSPVLVAHHFVIEGHADGRGQADVNLRISRWRAEAVRNWLITLGAVSPDRLTIAAFGKDHPIFPNDILQNYRYNRRIEIVRRFMP